MKIISTKKDSLIVFNTDMPVDERDMLLKYADKKMPKSALEEAKINWAFTDIIKLSIKKEESKLKKPKKKK